MDVADPVVGLDVRAQAEGGAVEARGVEAGLAQQGVGLDPGPLDDLVLEQPMDDDHVRPEQLLPAGDLLDDRLAVVDDELEVEVRDPAAGVALARRRLPDVAPAAAEAEVAALDGVEQQRPVDGLADGVGERRVALELGQPEAGAEGGDHRADEVGEDVLGVVELDVGEVAGVAGDVGDEERRGLGGCHRHHCTAAPSRR